MLESCSIVSSNTSFVNVTSIFREWLILFIYIFISNIPWIDYAKYNLNVLRIHDKCHKWYFYLLFTILYCYCRTIIRDPKCCKCRNHVQLKMIIPAGDFFLFRSYQGWSVCCLHAWVCVRLIVCMCVCVSCDWLQHHIEVISSEEGIHRPLLSGIIMLSERPVQQRWSMFGHVRRMPKDIPNQTAQPDKDGPCSAISVGPVIFRDRGKLAEFAELPTWNGIREMTRNHGISFVIS